MFDAGGGEIPSEEALNVFLPERLLRAFAVGHPECVDGGVPGDVELVVVLRVVAVGQVLLLDAITAFLRHRDLQLLLRALLLHLKHAVFLRSHLATEDLVVGTVHSLPFFLPAFHNLFYRYGIVLLADLREVEILELASAELGV
jgi:hypothetical protein